MGEHFNGPFNFDATPIVPLGSPIIIHTKPGNGRSWDYRGQKGFIIGPAFEHYRCFGVVDATTKASRISDTIKVLHDYLTQPEVTVEDRIVHALNFLSCALKDATASAHHEQLEAITKLRDIFTGWKTKPDYAAPPLPQAPPYPTILPAQAAPPPRVVLPPPAAPPPRVVPPPTVVPPSRVELPP